MFDRFDPLCRELVQDAMCEARQLASPETGCEHIILAILAKGEPAGALSVLAGAGLSAANVRSWLAGQVEPNLLSQTETHELPPLSREVAKAVGAATGVTLQRRSSLITADVVCFAALNTAKSDSVLDRLCSELAITCKELSKKLFEDLSLDTPVAPVADEDVRRVGQRRTRQESPSELLDAFGTELVAQARTQRFDPHVGRDQEIAEMIGILLRRTKCNPVLIGEPGVGKTALVEGLAQKIADGDVPQELANKRILSLDTSSLVAGARNRGDFEERMKKLIKLVTSSDDIILFIDEIHQILGAGGNTGGLDMANMLKPAMSRGEIAVIGATTLNEYRKYIESDKALERRFRAVKVEPSTVAQTTEILTRIAPRFAAHHKVEYTREALSSIATLADRYVKDRFLPDKAIDVLDEVGAKLAMQRSKLSGRELEAANALAELRVELAVLEDPARAADNVLSQSALVGELDSLNADSYAYGVIDEVAVRACVAEMVNVPLDVVDVDAARSLASLEQRLASRLFGQEEAVRAVSAGVKRRRAGLGDTKRPASFLFTGGTGRGKTEMARALADMVFGGESHLVQIDMSEYMEKHSLSRLVGAPPGYVGYDEPGQLTEKVRRLRSCVVLLDEIDKAHPDVSNLLLQVLEEGRLTDGTGRVVDFSDTIVIATCNVTGTTRARSVGFKTTGSPQMNQSEVFDSLLKFFRPEQLNRFDEIVHFKDLPLSAIEAGVVKEFAPFAEQLAERSISVSWSQSAKSLLANLGFDQDLGMRPLRRVLQHLVLDEVAAMLLAGELCDGDELVIDAVGDQVMVLCKKQASSSLLPAATLF